MQISFLIKIGFILVLGIFVFPKQAQSNLYQRKIQQPDGSTIIQYTAEPPKAKERKHWKVIYEKGPGRAKEVSGATYSSFPGCQVSRRDVVPARDKAKERFHRYDSIIQSASDEYLLPTNLIRAIIRVESDFDPNVESCAGAKGLMQIMPEVAVDHKIEKVLDPVENILGGTRRLRQLANQFDGDLQLTIAAYHAGSGAVHKYKGIPPYQTTQIYVSLVLKAYEKESQI